MSHPSRPRTQITDPTGKTVAANVRRVRDRRGWSTYDMSRRLSEAGRPMTPSAIAKVERAERRVDAGDLMALSAVLGVPPSALLLPLDDSPGSSISLTGGGEVSAEAAWDWLDGKRPLVLGADAETAMLEFMLFGRPPRRRRPRGYLKGERTPEQLAATRRHWNRLIDMGAVDPEIARQLDREAWAEGDD